jgi:hypothetical protein
MYIYIHMHIQIDDYDNDPFDFRHRHPPTLTDMDPFDPLDPCHRAPPNLDDILNKVYIYLIDLYESIRINTDTYLYIRIQIYTHI